MFNTHGALCNCIWLSRKWRHTPSSTVDWTCDGQLDGSSLSCCTTLHCVGTRKGGDGYKCLPVEQSVVGYRSSVVIGRDMLFGVRRFDSYQLVGVVWNPFDLVVLQHIVHVQSQHWNGVKIIRAWWTPCWAALYSNVVYNMHTAVGWTPIQRWFLYVHLVDMIPGMYNMYIHVSGCQNSCDPRWQRNWNTTPAKCNL